MTSTQATRRPADRRPALDLLRALVVVGLVFFHSALVFDTRDDYYIKNPETTDVSIVAAFGVVWAMPLLFLVAGTGTWHSLRRRGTAAFATERLRRLGVPLVFATLTIIPVPQWLRLRAADPGYDDSYLQFLPQFFDVRLELTDFPFVLEGRYFETGHLWFIVLLLVFSFLLLPGFGWLIRGRGPRTLSRTLSPVTRRGVIFLGCVPIAVISGALGLEESYAAWSRWAYLLFFLYGFVIAADGRVRTAMRRDAVVAAVLGVTLFAAGGAAFFATGDDPFTDTTPIAVGGRMLYGAAGWCWLVAILGLLDRARRPPAEPATEDASTPARSRWLPGYVSEAVLPFYILHQPIVVAVAYFVVGWNASMPVKYVVIVAASLMLTVAAYDLLVRRTPVTRFLFGMRPSPASDRTVPARSGVAMEDHRPGQ